MADIFTKKDARKLLQGKSLLLCGDSNMRGTYKDILWLLEENTLISQKALKGKLERSFMRDLLVKGGTLHRGRNFQEIRQYQNFELNISIEYIFLTQCFSEDIQAKLKSLQNHKEFPDVIIMNSCLWDITRWGPDSVEMYKKNIINILELLKSTLPPKSKVIWTTTPPISNNPKGGFFIKQHSWESSIQFFSCWILGKDLCTGDSDIQIEFLKHTLRFEVMEANEFVSKAVISYGFDVLDIHYHLLLQIHRRQLDGIHWKPESMRHITNLILTHISISWAVPLPGNFITPLLKNAPNLKNNPVSATPILPIPETSAVQNTSVSNKKKKKKRNKGKNRDLNANYAGVKRKFDNFEYNSLNNKRFKSGFR